MEKKDHVYRGRKKMLLDNFLGGIVWSIGMWLGTTVIIALLAFFLSKVNLVPIVGDFVAEVSKHATKSASPFDL